MGTWETSISEQAVVMRSTDGVSLFIDNDSRFCGDTQKGRRVKWCVALRCSHTWHDVHYRILLDGAELPEAAGWLNTGTMPHDQHFFIHTEAPVPDGTRLEQLGFVFTVGGE